MKITVHNKMDVEIQISPRMMCPCGKSVLKLTDEQRKAYDDAVRRAEEARTHDARDRGESAESTHDDTH